MPLKRTPPKTPVQSETATKSRDIIRAAVSAPNLSDITEPGNITVRKRKREDCCAVFMDEIRDLLKSHTNQTNSKLKTLQAAKSEIISQNAEIKETISYISKQYDDMALRTDKLEAQRKTDLAYINQLEDRVEILERMTNMSKLEFKNIPKSQGEDKERLCNLAIETASTLGTTLQRQEIKDIFRISKKEGASTIIVDFTSVTMKDNIIKGVRKFNKQNKGNKLNTSHIKIAGPSKPIFITECLTLKAQRLYYLARNYAKENNYKVCWTSYGKVFLRKADGEKQILVKNESDIQKLRQDIVI